jgi:hypothetical protein
MTKKKSVDELFNDFFSPEWNEAKTRVTQLQAAATAALDEAEKIAEKAGITLRTPDNYFYPKKLITFASKASAILDPMLESENEEEQKKALKLVDKFYALTDEDIGSVAGAEDNEGWQVSNC